eukprot:PhF_6_TR7972/c2_g1_i2/m.12143/K17914/KIF13; kinesin family member 13
MDPQYPPEFFSPPPPLGVPGAFTPMLSPLPTPIGVPEGFVGQLDFNPWGGIGTLNVMNEQPLSLISDSVSTGVAEKCGLQVFVRVRPYNAGELEDMRKLRGIPEQTALIVKSKQDSGTVLNLMVKPTEKSPLMRVYDDTAYVCDDCFWSVTDVQSTEVPYSNQRDVYDRVGRPVLEQVVKGFNACVFAYGQTGSGKTYTMMGSGGGGEEQGLIPRMAQQLLAEYERMKSSTEESTFTLTASYYEIYNEKLFDLLDDASAAPLAIRQHPVDGLYVQGLHEETIESWSDMQKLLSSGAEKRHIAATKMNRESSRSHAVFVITVNQTRQQLKDPVSGKVEVTNRRSKLNLVDLAGSERLKKSGAEGSTQVEAANINLSLSMLGKVIDELLDNQRTLAKDPKAKTKFVSYRNSTLTRVLQESLGGNSRTVMVATVSPYAGNYEETKSTLLWATRARKLVNKVRVNENQSTKLMEEITNENERLQARINAETETNSQLLEQLERNTRLLEELRKQEEQFRVTAQLREKELLMRKQESEEQKRTLQEEALALRMQNVASKKMLADNRAKVLALEDELRARYTNEALQRRYLVLVENSNNLLNEFVEELFTELEGARNKMESTVIVQFINVSKDNEALAGQVTAMAVHLEGLTNIFGEHQSIVANLLRESHMLLERKRRQRESMVYFSEASRELEANYQSLLQSLYYEAQTHFLTLYNTCISEVAELQKQQNRERIHESENLLRSQQHTIEHMKTDLLLEQASTKIGLKREGLVAGEIQARYDIMQEYEDWSRSTVEANHQFLEKDAHAKHQLLLQEKDTLVAQIAEIKKAQEQDWLELEEFDVLKEKVAERELLLLAEDDERRSRFALWQEYESWSRECQLEEKRAITAIEVKRVRSEANDMELRLKEEQRKRALSEVAAHEKELLYQLRFAEDRASHRCPEDLILCETCRPQRRPNCTDCWNYVLGKHQLLFWQPDDDVTHCIGCLTPFSFLRRRHHCRICGYIFCWDCLKANQRCLHPSTSTEVLMCKGCNESYISMLILFDVIAVGNEGAIARKIVLSWPRVALAKHPRYRTSALYFAAKLGRVDIMEHLIKVTGVNVNERCGSTHSTALHQACYYDHMEAVRLLLSSGALCSVTNQLPRGICEKPLENVHKPDIEAMVRAADDAETAGMKLLKPLLEVAVQRVDALLKLVPSSASPSSPTSVVATYNNPGALPTASVLQTENTSAFSEVDAQPTEAAAVDIVDSLHIILSDPTLEGGVRSVLRNSLVHVRADLLKASEVLLSTTETPPWKAAVTLAARNSLSSPKVVSNALIAFFLCQSTEVKEKTSGELVNVDTKSVIQLLDKACRSTSTLLQPLVDVITSSIHLFTPYCRRDVVTRKIVPGLGTNTRVVTFPTYLWASESQNNDLREQISRLRDRTDVVYSVICANSAVLVPCVASDIPTYVVGRNTNFRVMIRERVTPSQPEVVLMQEMRDGIDDSIIIRSRFEYFQTRNSMVPAAAGTPPPLLKELDVFITAAIEKAINRTPSLLLLQRPNPELVNTIIRRLSSCRGVPPHLPWCVVPIDLDDAVLLEKAKSFSEQRFSRSGESCNLADLLCARMQLSHTYQLIQMLCSFSVAVVLQNVTEPHSCLTFPREMDTKLCSPSFVLVCAKDESSGRTLSSSIRSDLFFGQITANFKKI